jgi:hypothetical protein
MLFFYGERLLALHLTPMLEAICSIRNPRAHHALVTRDPPDMCENNYHDKIRRTAKDFNQKEE